MQSEHSDAMSQCYSEDSVYRVKCLTHAEHKKISQCDDWDRVIRSTGVDRRGIVRVKLDGKEKVRHSGKKRSMRGKHESNDGITIESSRFPSALVSSAWVPFSTVCALSACSASCSNEMISFGMSVTHRIVYGSPANVSSIF